MAVVTLCEHNGRIGTVAGRIHTPDDPVSNEGYLMAAEVIRDLTEPFPMEIGETQVQDSLYMWHVELYLMSKYAPEFVEATIFKIRAAALERAKIVKEDHIIHSSLASLQSAIEMDLARNVTWSPQRSHRGICKDTNPWHRISISTGTERTMNRKKYPEHRKYQHCQLHPLIHQIERRFELLNTSLHNFEVSSERVKAFQRFAEIQELFFELSLRLD